MDHTLDESFNMAVDCLAGYLYWLQKDGELAPAASPIEKINVTALAKELEVSPDNAFVNIVTVDVAEYAKVHFEKSVKKTLTIPAWLNERALAMNINFSQVLQEALLNKIQG